MKVTTMGQKLLIDIRKGPGCVVIFPNSTRFMHKPLHMVKKNANLMIVAVFEAVSQGFLNLRVGFTESPSNERDNNGSKNLSKHQGRGFGCVVICPNPINHAVYA